ncbi:MAG: RsmE family RNA methyltransferase [bacterium]|nr:RsmE family RNA methyltransferase [bacterium]
MRKKIHRFVGDFSFEEQTILIADTKLAHQIARVLRLVSGEMVDLVNKAGQVARGEITSITDRGVLVAIKEKFSAVTDAPVSVTLYLALLKREHFELAAQKATEVGVAEIVPVITHRTVKLKLKLERVKKIITESVEQSGRHTVPSISEPMSFSAALADAERHDQIFLFDLDAPPFDSHGLSGKKIAIFIGPEGGWDAGEIEQAKAKNCTIVGLGHLTLRGETAAILATYLAANPLD